MYIRCEVLKLQDGQHGAHQEGPRALSDDTYLYNHIRHGLLLRVSHRHHCAVPILSHQGPPKHSRNFCIGKKRGSRLHRESKKAQANSPQLLAAGVLTEAFLLGAFFVSCCFPISPIIYLIVHTLLLLLWTVAGILLAVYSSRTLLNDCPSSRWGEAGWGGQLLCRSFKALFAFAFLAWYVVDLLGLVSALHEVY